LRVLVTGGNGYIGTRLVDRMQTLFSKWTIETLDKKHGEDLLEEHTIAPYSHFDKVVHLASHTSTRSVDPTINQQNIYMLRNILKFFDRDQIVFSSSAAVYAPGIDLMESMIPAPQSEYGRSKLECERLLRDESVILRLFNVYGGGYGIVDLLLNRPKVVIYGDGSQIRDYVYIEQVVNSFIYALQWAKPGVYNIGTGIGTSINDIIDMLNVKDVVEYDPHKQDLVGVKYCTANILKSMGAGFPNAMPIREVLARLKYD
jgi:UDP-glucose 4-epimerase